MTNGRLIMIVLCQAVSVLGHQMAVWKRVEQNRQWWLDCCSGQQLSPATSRRCGSNFTPVSSVQCSPASLWSHKFWQIHNFSQWRVSCDGVTWSFVRSLGCRIISVITQQRSKSANPPTHRAAGPHNYTARAIGELISCSKTQKWFWWILWNVKRLVVRKSWIAYWRWGIIEVKQCHWWFEFGNNSCYIS